MADGDIYEYMKLRQYLVAMVRKTSGDTAMPSERELARMFGCARITASHALNDLVQSGYLIKRPRRGYFANSVRTKAKQKNQKIIGLLISSGTNVFYDYDGMNFISELNREMTKYDVCSQIVISSRSEMLFNDINNCSLDGLLWIGADGNVAVFEQIYHENRIPIVGLFNILKPSCGNYCFLDHAQEGYLKTCYLLERGCRNILCINAKEKWDQASKQGYQTALKEAGIEPNPELSVDADVCLERLPELFSRYSIDGVVARFCDIDHVKNYAIEQGIRIPEQLQIINHQYYYDWNPTVSVKPFKAISVAMMKQLWGMMEGKKTIMQKSDFQWTIKQGTSTK